MIISTFEVDMDRNIIVDLDPHTLLLFNKNRLVDFTTYDDNIFNEGKDFVNQFTLRSYYVDSVEIQKRRTHIFTFFERKATMMKERESSSHETTMHMKFRLLLQV